jgi:hypothetical protein|tara:strand:- start:219 stop:434 length:216 start_codon:yes stop_codon:yes gene_type:complete
MRNVKGKGIKSPAELVGLKPFKDAKLLRHEAIERMKRRMKRNLKEAQEKARLAQPYVRDADAPSFDGRWLG